MTRIEAAGTLSSVNDWLNTNIVPAGIVTGALLGLGGVLWAAFMGRRRIGWKVVYDQPINTGPQGGRHMWRIVTGKENPPREVVKPSLVILEIRNSGFTDIDDSAFATQLEFMFPERTVEDFKVRASDEDDEDEEVGDFHKLIKRDEQTMPADQPSTIVLPKLPLNRRSRFRLMIVLSGDPKGVKRSAGILRQGGRIHEYGRHPSRRIAALTLGALLVLGAGAAGGVLIANKALTPQANCASGTLDVSGSTAFAPIVTIARNAYAQQCSNAHIAVSAVGSSAGLAHLESAADPSSVVAMVDGAPPQDPGPGFHKTYGGVVIFAVVANRSIGGSLTADTVQKLFDGATAPTGYVLVGRAAGSGTRNAFDSTVLLGKPESALDGAPTCPPPGTGTVSACTAATTMDLLSYVNATPNAIGYAEADALSFFPNIDTVPLDGAMPTREDALHHGYPFVATEYLYTGASESVLTTDFLEFLTSDAMTARLHDTGFVSCSEVRGTDLNGQCV